MEITHSDNKRLSHDSAIVFSRNPDVRSLDEPLQEVKNAHASEKVIFARALPSRLITAPMWPVMKTTTQML